MDTPSDEIVRFFTGRVYNGQRTQKVITQFTDITKRALNQFVNDRINERLKSALGPDSPTVEASRPASPPAVAAATIAAAAPVAADESKIVTTDEEREAFYIVKAILREVVDPKRVVIRDQQSYCAVLLDDNNRKPICRFYLGTAKKQLGLFDAEKKEERVTITDLQDIFKHAPRLKEAIGHYAGK